MSRMTRALKESVMSSTRPSLVRLFKIHQAINDRTYPSAERLAELCEVNARTIKRDLKALRDEFSAPVVYARKRGGYYYTRDYTFNSVPLSEGELLALCMMRAMADTFKSTHFAPAIERALRKLQVMLPETAQSALNGDNAAITCLGEASPPERVETSINFNTLLSAVDEHRQIRIKYYSMSRNATSTRVVDPYHIFYRRGMWYLYAYCHLRQAMRDFALERISEIELLDATFPAPDMPAVRARLAQRFSLIEDQPIAAAIWFDIDYARRIRERIWHPSQRIEEHADGSLTLHLNVEGLASVARWVLGFGRHAKPVAPPELVDTVYQEACAIVSQLTPDP